MRIGIDGSCLANRRGFGRFARQMLVALAEAPSRHEFVVFVDRPSSPVVHVPGRFERVEVELGEAPSRAASASGRRRIGDMLAMGRAVARTGLDLIYFPATYSFFPVWDVRR
ncbi:MAG: glycosyltransferase family 1 protein, partial [Singulisphaera sp.]|nr:glycosyltransferase family 1 protein [Singulisphaera sp.]